MVKLKEPDLIALHDTAKSPLPSRRAGLLFPGARNGQLNVRLAPPRRPATKE